MNYTSNISANLSDILNGLPGYTDSIGTTSNATSAVVSAGLAAFLGIFVFIIISIAIVLCVLQIISLWKIFTKAGEKGWKAIIPIYNSVVLYRLSGISPWLILVCLLAPIPFLGAVAIFAVNIYLSHNLAKSFGKDIGYTVGLVVPATSWIFYLILGLGKDEYVGPSGIAPEPVKEVKVQARKSTTKASATTKKTTATKTATAKKATTTKASTAKKTTTKKPAAKKTSTAKKTTSKK